MKRTLSLTRESLTELTDTALSGVAGAQAVSGATCPVLDCLSGAVCALTQNPRCW